MDCSSCNDTGLTIRGHDGRKIRCPECLGTPSRRRAPRQKQQPSPDPAFSSLSPQLRDQIRSLAKGKEVPKDKRPIPAANKTIERWRRRLTARGLKRKLKLAAILATALVLLAIVTGLLEPENFGIGNPLSSDRRRAAETSLRPHESDLELKSYMVELINKERRERGLRRIKLGTNNAAQLHAAAALEGCYSAHWDRWGLKPNHRYTLAGGTGAEGENVSGSDYCIKPWDNYKPIGSMKEEVKDTTEGFMRSRGHRRNILDPAHTELNIGIANDQYNVVIVQQFSSDYVTYSRPPQIDSKGILRMKGVVKYATLDLENTVNIQIYYDPPPQALTRGQLSHTYSLCGSKKIGYLSEAGRNYSTPALRKETKEIECIDPYDTPADHPAPNTEEEAHEAWVAAKAKSQRGKTITREYRRLEAQRLAIKDRDFDVVADLNQVLKTHGPGIYTILLWGKPTNMKENSPVSEQAIFWKIEPPEDNPYQKSKHQEG